MCYCDKYRTKDSRLRNSWAPCFASPWSHQASVTAVECAETCFNCFLYEREFTNCLQSRDTESSWRYNATATNGSQVAGMQAPGRGRGSAGVESGFYASPEPCPWPNEQNMMTVSCARGRHVIIAGVLRRMTMEISGSFRLRYRQETTVCLVTCFLATLEWKFVDCLVWSCVCLFWSKQGTYIRKHNVRRHC